MERHVIEAALATVRPNSTPEARSHASSSLEAWTRSEHTNTNSDGSDPAISTWETYVRLLRHFFDSSSSNDNKHDYVEKIALETMTSATVSSPSNAALSTVKSEAIGAKLLLLTMLHAKVRRDFRALVSHRPDVAVAVRDEIGLSLTRLGQIILAGNINGDGGLVAPLCSSAAAVAVRLGGRENVAAGGAGGIAELVGAARLSIVTPHNVTSGSPPASSLIPPIALAVLSCLPEEAQASDMSATEVDNVLRSSVSQALEAIYLALVRSLSGGGTSDIPASLKALEHWCGPCHVTLSQLNVSPAADSGVAAGGDQPSFLALLVRILSENNPPSEEILKAASNALAEAILQTSDAGSPTRVEAIRMIFSAIPAHGFLTAPFTHCSSNDWDEALHSLACLAGDLATEEVETIAACQLPGCPEFIQILLQLQCHPYQPVAISVLEFWLALQDIPTSDRHPSLAAPLFGQLVDGLVSRVAYTPTFTTWENEYDLDRQEFDELRRLVADVLVSSYFLLRCNYLERLANVIQSSQSDPNGWAATESALFCLCSASREVCARVKARGAGTVAADRDATARGLVQLVQILCHGGAEAAASRHHLVLTRSASFVGSYAPVWNVCCSADDILELLRYLVAAMGTGADASAAAAKSIKLVLIGCSSKLLPAATAVSDSNSNPVSAVMSAAMEASLATHNMENSNLVAEGCTRLAVQLKDTDIIRQYLGILVSPLIRISQQATEVVRASSSAVNDGGSAARVEAACQTLSMCLCSLREVVRFCEKPAQESANSSTSTWHPLADVMSAIWPILNDVSSLSFCRAHEDVLSRLLDLHGQLLASAPDLVAPHFSQLITFVVQAYEETHLPCTLDYVGDAIELFGGKADADAEVSFNQLLAHISQRTFVYVTQERRPNECPQVIRALFDMTRRYLLFCPVALIKCPEFSSLFALAVACLTECKGERDSTRATLNFLSQLIGWRTLRLSAAVQAVLEASASAIDTAIVQHGETLTRICIGGLSGGGPQMLWPAYSECFFAVMVNAVGRDNGTPAEVNGHGAQNTFAHQWIYAALSDDELLGNVPTLTSDVRSSILQLLCGLVLRDGPKAKPRVKMLLGDFGKICKGDATPDALLAYSLS